LAPRCPMTWFLSQLLQGCTLQQNHLRSEHRVLPRRSSLRGLCRTTSSSFTVHLLVPPRWGPVLPHLRMARAYGRPRRACCFLRRPPLASPSPEARQRCPPAPSSERLHSGASLLQKQATPPQYELSPTPPRTPVHNPTRITTSCPSGSVWWTIERRLASLRSDELILIHIQKFECKPCPVAMPASDCVARSTWSRLEGGHVQGRSRRMGRGRPSAHGRHDGETCNQMSTELRQPLPITAINTIRVVIRVAFLVTRLRAVDAARPAPRPAAPPRRRRPSRPSRDRRRSCAGCLAVTAAAGCVCGASKL